MDKDLLPHFFCGKMCSLMRRNVVGEWWWCIMYFTSSWNQHDLVSAKLCNSFKALPPLDLKGNGAEIVPLSPVRARDLEEALSSHPARRSCGHRGTQLSPEAWCWSREESAKRCSWLTSCCPLISSQCLSPFVWTAHVFLWIQREPETSLVVQWLMICLPIQGTWVWSLVWEDTTCNSAHASQLLGSLALEPLFHHKRRHHNE